MSIQNFYEKYGIGITDFFEIYLNRFMASPGIIRIWNPIKLLKMCRDLPIKTINEEYPREYKYLMDFMSVLEIRIEEVKTEDVGYFKHQIKPHL